MLLMDSLKLFLVLYRNFGVLFLFQFMYFFIIQVFIFGISGTTCREKSSQMWNSVKIDYCKTGLNWG